jgi:hypothetical protein
MKVEEIQLTASEVEQIIKTLTGRGAELVARLVCAKRDRELIHAAEELALSGGPGEYPNRKASADAAVAKAQQYTTFLNVWMELKNTSKLNTIKIVATEPLEVGVITNA